MYEWYMKYTPSIYFIEKKERKKNEIPSTAASTKIAKSRERWEPVNFQEFIGARREGWFSTVDDRNEYVNAGGAQE